jgi:hypothetical protein
MGNSFRRFWKEPLIKREKVNPKTKRRKYNDRTEKIKLPSLKMTWA